jgi:photosystem II stability/assembly factor-like uncharacterized protein
MIIRELIPRIDQRYRTIASRGGRAAHGFSMGSSGSLKFVIKYPDLFCSAVAYGGGAVDLAKTKSKFILDILERNLSSKPELIRQNNTYHFLDSNAKLVRENQIEIMLVCGEEDSWMDSALTFQKALSENAIPCQLARVPGVGHGMRALAAAEGRSAAIFQNKIFRRQLPLPVAHIERQFSGVTSSFRGMALRGSSEAWATGSGGTVLRTTDSGKTWKRLPVPDSKELDFRDVEVLPDGSVLLMSIGGGDKSRILRSADAGSTWETVLVNREPDGFFDGMALSHDGRHGILYGDPIDGQLDLYRTADGGKSWRRNSERSRPKLNKGEYSFAASGTGIVAHMDDVFVATGGSVARVLHSSDRGETWSIHNTPLRSGNESSGVFSLAFIDAKRGVIIGGDYAQPALSENNIARTEDGGKTWMPLPAVEMPHKACIRSIGDGQLIACGRTGVAFSDDAGVTWRHLSHEGYYTLAVDSDSKTGFMAGSDGRIARIKIAR